MAPWVFMTVTMPLLNVHVKLQLLKVVLVTVMVFVLPPIVIWKGFVKLLHEVMHVRTIPLTKVPVLNVGSLVLEMLFANAAVGKVRAKSANGITRLIHTSPARRFVGPSQMQIANGEDSFRLRVAVLSLFLRNDSTAHTMYPTVRTNNCYF